MHLRSEHVYGFSVVHSATRMLGCSELTAAVNATTVKLQFNDI